MKPPLLYCCIASLLLSGCISDDEPSDISKIAVGDKLPYFSIVLNNGDRISTDMLQGTPSMIVFFNTECRDCQHELPAIQQFYNLHPEVITICISREESNEMIEAYWKENNLSLPYSAQHTRTVYNLFATEGIPRIYMSDSKLTVTSIWDDNNLPNLNQLTQAIPTHSSSSLKSL